MSERDRFAALAPIELATTLTLAPRATPVEPLPDVRPGQAEMRRALEDAVLPALLRPPCVVSFSGGRDSSLVLAVAVHVARREGLPLPIPVTLEFDTERSKETEWQLAVVRHLGLDEWRHLPITDELQLLGPYDRDVLERHGVALPTNVYVHAPIAEQASGGSVLTGVGGDEIFQTWLWSRRGMVAFLRHNRHRLVVHQLLSMSLPPPVRRAVLRRVRRVRLPWLTPGAVAEATAAVVEREARYVPTFQAAMDMYWNGRYRELLHGSLEILGRGRDVRLVSPFATPEFLATVRATMPPSGFTSRTDAMRDLGGDLLPPETVGRSTKAVFTEVFWGERARRFAAEWDGRGLPGDYVDADALRQAWQQPRVGMSSWALLQQAWLTSDRVEPRTAP